jgi:uncharacterized protein (TIGR02118 family)
MIHAISMWKLPAGVKEEDFEKWYNEKHVPDVRGASPKLLKYVTNKVVNNDPDSYYRMAEFYFASVDDMNEAFASDGWKAAVADAGPWIDGSIRCFFESTVQLDRT